MNKAEIASLVTALPPRNDKLYDTSISKVIHPLHLTPYNLQLTLLNFPHCSLNIFQAGFSQSRQSL